VNLLICGARGSTPSPGAEFVRYGGHTACVAVARDGEEPHLVLDAGTGLRRLTRALDDRPFRGTILIGHLHWDHTQGLPFFRSGDMPGASVRVLIPEQGDASAVLARVMSPPHFPVRCEDLRGAWSIGSLDEGEHDIEGFGVVARDIHHKLSRTFGFRVTDGARTFAYLSDHWQTALGVYDDAARALATGADLLVHDAQYTVEEFAERADFGHSTIEHAIGLAEACGVPRVLLFHHDPDRTDDDLDAIVDKCAGGPVEVSAAVEGSIVEV
jgi:phosphoribosyl 1,2-cyclic phosphodiesterase